MRGQPTPIGPGFVATGGNNGAANLGVATGTNRVNSSGSALPDAKSRASLVITNIIAPGATVPFPVTGTQFYLMFATNSLNIRPSGGIFNPYVSGTGEQFDLANAFALVEVNNPTAAPVVFQLFIGWQQFIDNRLFLQNNQLPLVAFPTYPTANSATNVNINDLSGTQFTDINGIKWYAITRTALQVFNPDTGVTLLLQKAGSVVANGPAVGVIYPQTSLTLPISGNYCLNIGGGNINAIVSEIYQALAA